MAAMPFNEKKNKEERNNIKISFHRLKYLISIVLI